MTMASSSHIELTVLDYVGPPRTEAIALPTNPKDSRLECRHPQNGVLVPELGLSPGNEPRPVEKPTHAQVIQGRLQLAALFWTMFLAGWNDGSTGPLLPRIQAVYHVNDTIVSLIFVFACLGFVTGAIFIVPHFERLGFGRIIVAGAFLHMTASAIQSAKPPYPVFIMAYTLGGIGISTIDAGASAYVASLKENPETKMGLLHAAYGCGALCAPLVSTQFARLPEHWSYHFLVTLGLGSIECVSLALVFRFKSTAESLAAIGQPKDDNDTEGQKSFRQILMNSQVHLLAFFVLVYVGVEVTIGGWIVTYVIRLREGGPNSGYISSGFFAGLASGRVALLWANVLMGERLAAFVYSGLAIGLELIVWLVPSLIGGGVSIAIVGFLLGPLYPIGMNHARRILPQWMLTGSIGWICGFGQTGAAIIPFATGALAGKFGIGSLQPLLVAMMVCMIVLWAIVPGSPKRRD
ncbi:hypothetical protein PM082_013244 [Marasmius tenuissimus]|nr:hypothetical protein PM082_013244 [Marasmius tenuissimus]